MYEKIVKILKEMKILKPNQELNDLKIGNEINIFYNGKILKIKKIKDLGFLFQSL